MIAAALVFFSGLFFVSPSKNPSASKDSRLNLAKILGGEYPEGFARAEKVRAFSFPEDHGPHTSYRSEWWYFTGNLEDEKGRLFGYELTIFRFALTPEVSKRQSKWAINQTYMGHFALSDIDNKKFHAFERFSRGALGLAGAESSPFRVWVEDWSAVEKSPGSSRWKLRAKEEGVEIDLDLLPERPVVLQGERGLSRKSGDKGNASYYYSIPRFATAGTIEIDGKRWRVEGLSWLDREWSTSALAPDQAGWDWFALQLDNGYDLMFYRLRRRDGSDDPFSAGALIDPEGKKIPLTLGDLSIKELASWESPRGGTYPAKWQITIKAADIVLDIEPLMADQELDLSIRYWEGAVDVTGKHGGEEVTGKGYVELAGYSVD